jgi:hypothetical protein
MWPLADATLSVDPAKTIATNSATDARLMMSEDRRARVPLSPVPIVVHVSTILGHYFSRAPKTTA